MGKGGFRGAGGCTGLHETASRTGRMSRKQSRAGVAVFDLPNIHIVAYLIFVIE
jgi:hypothetical protein